MLARAADGDCEQGYALKPIDGDDSEQHRIPHSIDVLVSPRRAPQYDDDLRAQELEQQSESLRHDPQQYRVPHGVGVLVSSHGPGRVQGLLTLFAHRGLASNQLTGTIPSSIGSLSALNQL